MWQYSCWLCKGEADKWREGESKSVFVLIVKVCHLLAVGDEWVIDVGDVESVANKLLDSTRPTSMTPAEVFRRLGLRKDAVGQETNAFDVLSEGLELAPSGQRKTTNWYSRLKRLKSNAVWGSILKPSMIAGAYHLPTLYVKLIRAERHLRLFLGLPELKLTPTSLLCSNNSVLSALADLSRLLNMFNSKTEVLAYSLSVWDESFQKLLKTLSGNTEGSTKRYSDTELYKFIISVLERGGQRESDTIALSEVFDNHILKAINPQSNDFENFDGDEPQAFRPFCNVMLPPDDMTSRNVRTLYLRRIGRRVNNRMQQAGLSPEYLRSFSVMSGIQGLLFQGMRRTLTTVDEDTFFERFEQVYSNGVYRTVITSAVGESSQVSDNKSNMETLSKNVAQNLNAVYRSFVNVENSVRRCLNLPELRLKRSAPTPSSSFLVAHLAHLWQVLHFHIVWHSGYVSKAEKLRQLVSSWMIGFSKVWPDVSGMEPRPFPGLIGDIAEVLSKNTKPTETYRELQSKLVAMIQTMARTNDGGLQAARDDKRKLSDLSSGGLSKKRKSNEDDQEDASPSAAISASPSTSASQVSLSATIISRGEMPETPTGLTRLEAPILAAVSPPLPLAETASQVARYPHCSGSSSLPDTYFDQWMSNDNITTDEYDFFDVPLEI